MVRDQIERRAFWRNLDHYVTRARINNANNFIRNLKRSERGQPWGTKAAEFTTGEYGICIRPGEDPPAKELISLTECAKSVARDA